MNKILTTFILTMFLTMPMAHAKMDNVRGSRAGGERIEKQIEAMFEQLNLSEEQKKLIEANKLQNKAAKKQIWEAKRANMQAMGEELKKADLDMAKLTSLHEAQKKLGIQMADQRFNSILEVRKILTKEQFVKFAEMMEKKRERRGFLKNKE